MALDLDCPTCQTDDYALLVEKLTDTQRKLRCGQCGHEWLHGEPARQKLALPTLAEIRQQFPKPGDVAPDRLARAAELKSEFLEREPEPEPNVGPYWSKYQAIFSAEGLQSANLRTSRTSPTATLVPIRATCRFFNDAWNQMGPEAGAQQVRRVVDYLLRGTSPADLEDRLTALVNDNQSIGMKGFKESLLTKVLCIVYPERFLSITKYTGEAGKREIARSIWGLELPDPERVNWTIGRLILWSNDLLRALPGDGFKHQQHAAAFLWWAKDKS